MQNTTCHPRTGLSFLWISPTAIGIDVVPTVVIEAMREVGMDLRAAVPRPLTAELARDATWLITMGCGDACPTVPGVRRADWPLEDPKGQPLWRVRQIRDDIRQRVEAFLGDHGFV